MADDDKSDEVLNRVDALMRRHRSRISTEADIPLLTDTISEPDVPVLTDTIAPTQMPASSPSVAMTPIEESVYLKLRKELDKEMRGLTPQASAALDAALHKVSADLQDDIQRLVRSTIEQMLPAPNNADSAGIMPSSSANTPKTK